MKIFILYATYSGGTKTAAEYLADILTKKGHIATVSSVLTTTENGTYDLNLNSLLESIISSDLVIFASNTWLENGKEGQMNQAFTRLDTALASQKFDGVTSAIFCLGDENYAQFCGSVEHLSEFVTKHGGRLISPQLRINQFYARQKESEEKLENWVSTILLTVESLKK